MKGKIYTDIAEELKRLGGIDEIGVVSAAGQSAVIFSVSAMDTNDRQEALVEKLCGIVDTLAESEPAVDGISQARIKINSLPAPTMHNEHYWIYTAGIEIVFFIQK